MKPPEPFGALAVHLGYATPTQVVQALEAQRARETRSGKRVLLGTLMVELGIITPAQLLQILNHYAGHQFPISEDAIRLAVRLRTSLTVSDQMIVFTGAVAREGVSTVAAQVALVLARMEEDTVLLVDANFRAPALHAIFNVPQIPGLSDLIDRKVNIQKAIYPTELASLSILPAGNAAVNFLALLLSEECALLMKTLRQQFRLILVDSSPLLRFPDTALIASRTDGVVIVIAAGERRRAEVLEVKRLLDGLKIKVVGIVLCEKSTRLRSSASHNGRRR